MAKVTQAQRDAIVANCKLFNVNQKFVGYVQKRPFALYTKPNVLAKFKAKTVIDEWDCSACVSEIFLISGLKDPSGFGYKGLGNGDTMASTLPHYEDPLNAHPGAIISIGLNLPLAEGHVVIVVKRGKDPTVFSHGSDLSCKILLLSEEMTAHEGATVTYLDIAQLG